jgi:putative membrane protein (TIGR04086 family)
MQYDSRQTGMPPPSIEPTGFFTGVQIRAVITGVVVDYISTYVAMTVFVFGYLAKELAKNGEVTSELIAQYMASPEGLRVALIIGSLCTALGGFIAARRAKTLEIKHGAFVGLGSLIISFLEHLMNDQPVPLPEWFQFVSILLVIPAGALGGFVAGLLKERGNREFPQRPLR